MAVQYLGGLTVWPRKPSAGDVYTLTADDQAFKILFWDQPLIGKGRWQPAVDIRWTSLRAIDVSSTNTPRLNIVAIALFGVLGLAARREPGTYINLTTDGMDALFHSESPVAQVRPTVERLVPAFRQLLRVDGRSMTAQLTSLSEPQVGPAERLRQLEVLHAEGLITAEELAARRTAILAEL